MTRCSPVKAAPAIVTQRHKDVASAAKRLLIRTVRPAAALTKKWDIAARAFLFVSLCETGERCAEGNGGPRTLKQVQGYEGGENAGACQLPDFHVTPHLQSGTLVQILDALRPQEEPIWAVYPKRRHLLPKVRLLMDKLREELPGRCSRVGWRSGQEIEESPSGRSKLDRNASFSSESRSSAR